MKLKLLKTACLLFTELWPNYNKTQIDALTDQEILITVTNAMKTPSLNATLSPLLSNIKKEILVTQWPQFSLSENTVPIGYSGRAADSDLNHRDDPPSARK